MSPFKLNKGIKFLYKGEVYTLIKVLDMSTVFAKKSDTEETVKIPISEMEFIDEIDNNDYESKIDTEIISDKEWEIAKERFEIIKPLIKPDRTKKEIAEISEKYKIHISTIYRWINLYEKSGGLLSSLIPNYKSRGGKSKKRIAEEVEKLMDFYIKNVYLSRDRKPNKKRVYLEFLIECKEKGLAPAHYNTFLNRIKEISPYTVAERREGKVKAKGLYGSSEKSFEANYPLEIIQIDHTQLDIQLIDEIYGKPIGRPYITVALDIYSRMVYGFYLTLESPGFFSVGQTILRGVLRKEQYLNELGIEGKWEIWGIPKNLTIHTDNAKEFRSKDFNRFCEEFGISLTYRPRKMPSYGGHIERFMRTLNTEIHNLHGSTFSNPQKKGEYESEKKAIFTLNDLEKWIAHWIVNIYHKKVHSEINMSPEKRFQEGIIGNEHQKGIGLPPIISGQEAERLKISLLPSFTRGIQKDGIHFKNIRYYDNILKPFIRYGEKANKEKDKYVFKYDPRDMRFLYFLHPEHKTYYKISCRDKRLPKISIWELREIHKYIKEKNIKSYNENEILKAIKELYKIEQEALQKSKEARRKKSSRINHEKKEKLENKYIDPGNKDTGKQNNPEENNSYAKNKNENKINNLFDINDEETFEID